MTVGGETDENIIQIDKFSITVLRIFSPVASDKHWYFLPVTS